MTTFTHYHQGNKSNPSAKIGRNDNQHITLSGDSSGNYLFGMGTGGYANKNFIIGSDTAQGSIVFKPRNVEAMRIEHGNENVKIDNGNVGHFVDYYSGLGEDAPSNILRASGRVLVGDSWDFDAKRKNQTTANTGSWLQTGDVGNDNFMGTHTTTFVSWDAVDDELTVADASGLPSAGLILIKGEVVKYTGKTGDTLTGCTRAYAGSPSVTFAANDKVYEQAGAEGSRNYWFEGQAKMAVTNRGGDEDVSAIAISGASRTTNGLLAVGVSGYARKDAGATGGAWGIYGEVSRQPGVTGGAAWAMELGVMNYNADPGEVKIDPHNSGGAGANKGLMINAGGGDTNGFHADVGFHLRGSYEDPDTWQGAEKGKRFYAGLVFDEQSLVFHEGALNNSATKVGRAVSMSDRHAISWYDTSGNVKAEAFNDGTAFRFNADEHIYFEAEKNVFFNANNMSLNGAIYASKAYIPLGSVNAALNQVYRESDGTLKIK